MADSIHELYKIARAKLGGFMSPDLVSGKADVADTSLVGGFGCTVAPRKELIYTSKDKTKKAILKWVSTKLDGSFMFNMGCLSGYAGNAKGVKLLHPPMNMERVDNTRSSYTRLPTPVQQKYLNPYLEWMGRYHPKVAESISIMGTSKRQPWMLIDTGHCYLDYFMMCFYRLTWQCPWLVYYILWLDAVHFTHADIMVIISDAPRLHNGYVSMPFSDNTCLPHEAYSYLADLSKLDRNGPYNCLYTLSKTNTANQKLPTAYPPPVNKGWFRPAAMRATLLKDVDDYFNILKLQIFLQACISAYPQTMDKCSARHLCVQQMAAAAQKERRESQVKQRLMYLTMIDDGKITIQDVPVADRQVLTFVLAQEKRLKQLYPQDYAARFNRERYV